jgi:hypothetical protein
LSKCEYALFVGSKPYALSTVTMPYSTKSVDPDGLYPSTCRLRSTGHCGSSKRRTNLLSKDASQLGPKCRGQWVPLWTLRCVKQFNLTSVNIFMIISDVLMCCGYMTWGCLVSYWVGSEPPLGKKYVESSTILFHLIVLRLLLVKVFYFTLCFEFNLFYCV